MDQWVWMFRISLVATCMGSSLICVDHFLTPTTYQEQAEYRWIKDIYKSRGRQFAHSYYVGQIAIVRTKTFEFLVPRSLPEEYQDELFVIRATPILKTIREVQVTTSIAEWAWFPDPFRGGLVLFPAIASVLAILALVLSPRTKIGLIVTFASLGFFAFSLALTLDRFNPVVEF